MDLQAYFKPFRRHIIGIDKAFSSAYGEQPLIYMDWTASGRLYKPIEDRLTERFAPFVGNTHSEASITGTMMTNAYHQAQNLIKKHLCTGPDDVLIHAGFGMTAAVNKFQRILGIKIPEQVAGFVKLKRKERPVVFITHMEHHSNQTSWLETLADVVLIHPDDDGLVDLNSLEDNLKRYKHRPLKMGAFTACSNVTGICTPYHDMAKVMHEHDGYCFIDFAASAPYIDICMRPGDEAAKLDAIFFSPHKFLGGPGSSGVLIFDKSLYKNKIPDQPGGGTVDWTDPWGHHKFSNNIEVREDGGTPGFLQSIRAALAMQLKEKMGPENMLKREEKLTTILLRELDRISGVHILAGHVTKRLGIISFYINNLHYNLVVKLLNDRFGIQTRGGCSCAGTYGHYLLHVDQQQSRRITSQIDKGDLSAKPGWVRTSIHPTTTDLEIDLFIDAIKQIVKHGHTWKEAYHYSPCKNEFYHKKQKETKVAEWFSL